MESGLSSPSAVVRTVCTMGAAAERLDLADPAEVELAKEYLAIRSRISEARQRADRLRRLAEHVERQAAADEHVLRELEGALGMRAQLQIEQLDLALSGKRVAEVAVAVAKRELSPGQVIHYKEWFALLQAAGFRVNGKDPLASFLAHVSRAPEVEAIGRRSGQYRLRSA
jgi:hypothetical protein